jgi:hypothetical protein
VEQKVLALIDGKIVEIVVQSSQGGGNVGVAVDGGSPTTVYTQPALRIDFGSVT